MLKSCHSPQSHIHYLYKPLLVVLKRTNSTLLFSIVTIQQYANILVLCLSVTQYSLISISASLFELVEMKGELAMYCVYMCLKLCHAL